MSADQCKYFALRCPQCAAVGRAEWSEADGWAYLRDPREYRHLSFGFTRLKPDPVLRGNAMYYGQLVCSDCGTAAEVVAVKSAQYHSIKVSGMRAV